MTRKAISILTALALIALVVVFVWQLKSGSVRAQEAAATPTPTPVVNQHWQVECGDVEALEERLHTLNARGDFVGESQIHFSADGKRFVILISDADDDNGN